MDADLFAQLELKIEILLDKYQSLRQEKLLLHQENERLLSERQGFKDRIDAILRKLEEM